MEKESWNIDPTTIETPIFPGSFDPFTPGHLYVYQEALKEEPDTKLLVVRSTSKPAEYQLFTPQERAQLIHEHYNIPLEKILITIGETNEEIKNFLTRAHQAAPVIFKGVREERDSFHTRSVADKYKVPIENFREIHSPEQAIRFSSSLIKENTARKILGKKVTENQNVPPNLIQAVMKRMKDSTVRVIEDFFLHATENNYDGYQSQTAISQT